MNRERLFAALLFAAAASLFWFGFVAVAGLSADDGFVRGNSMISVAAAALVAAWLAPKLVLDARKTAGAMRGAAAGLAVTLMSYALGAVITSIVLVGSILTSEGGDMLGTAVLGLVVLPVIGTFHAVAQFSPAIAFGVVAGLIFYHLARADAMGAT